MAKNVSYSKLTRVLSSSMLLHHGYKRLQCLHQYWQCVWVCSILLGVSGAKYFMRIKSNSFQKGNKDLLPQIFCNVRSSNTQSGKDVYRLYVSCFNSIGNSWTELKEIRKWTTRHYPVALVNITHCLKCLNIITKKAFKSRPRISFVQMTQSIGGDRQATDVFRLLLTASDIRRTA